MAIRTNDTYFARAATHLSQMFAPPAPLSPPASQGAAATVPVLTLEKTYALPTATPVLLLGRAVGTAGVR